MINPVRTTTAFVLENSKDVKINKDKIKEIASLLKKEKKSLFEWTAEMHFKSKNQQTMLDYLILADAMNFCFWNTKERWNINYKGKKINGYFALSLALKDFFEKNPKKANLDYFSKIPFFEFKKIFQGGKNLYFLRDRWKLAKQASQKIIKKYENSESFVNSAGKSAEKLVFKIAKELPGFNDTAKFKGKKIYFLKRAQILVCDIWGALKGRGAGKFKDMDYLTCFADYKVPQILNLLGIIEYSEDLQKKIEKRTLIPAGSRQEIEIRSATVQAVELLRNEFKKTGKALPAFKIDWILWNKTQEIKMDNPYHLTKTIFY